jgi:prepilin-type N-terminal cleavage/methylation domain-containing protein
MRRAHGFTLIEMVMSMLIIGMLGTAAAMAISYGVRATFETQTRVDTQSDLRLATERLAREIRLMRRDPAAPANYDIVAPRTATRLSFRRLDSNGSSVRTVTIDASTPSTITLNYDSPAVAPAPVLVNRVSAFTLTYLQADGVAVSASNADLAFVVIDLTITDTYGNAYNQRTRVALRNRQ